MKAFPLVSGGSVLQPLRRCSRALRLTGLTVSLLALFAGCSRVSLFLSSLRPSNQPTEQRWIIGSIVRDCANLAAFAAAPERWSDLPASAVEVREKWGVPAGEGYAVSIKLPEGEPVAGDLKITATVWSPELYGPLVRALNARLKAAPPAGNGPAGGQPDADLLNALSNPLTAQIEAQNQRLSGWLQAHPLDARGHQQAALLLGTLALRENSGLFWNPRGLCNRAAAHLAFARALRPEVSECGEVAELLIGLIIDTKADCQRRIAALQARVATHPELGPWATAAAMRNTRDYRLLTNPRTATFLERIEQFRAMSEAISTEQASTRMVNFQPNIAPDWERIVLQSGFGVGTGHTFALPSTALESNDAIQVFPALRTLKDPAQIAAILNLPPGGPVQPDEAHRARLRVIDQGTWAQFFQRHLLQAADETYDFLEDKWGVRDKAAEFRQQALPQLQGLTLYPLCLEHLGKADAGTLSAAAANLWTQHPEWVSDGAWAEIVKTVPPQYAQGGDWAALSKAWFSPVLPTGTVYGFDWRMDTDNAVARPDLPELQRLYAIAPLKYDVCRLYLNSLTPDHHATAAQCKQVLGALPAYYLPAMWGEAYLVQSDPAQYGPLMNQAALLDPMYYLSLGQYYVEHRMAPQAAQAYQAAIDHGADAVAVANQCDWLVNYYYDHGQQDHAMTIAQQAAEVYSSRGLETMAKLLERMGRDREAESYFEKINERYHDAKPLHRFYAREAISHPAEYTEKIKTAQKEIFPQGLAEVTLAQLTGKPTRGVLVHGENEISRQCGLKPGAIVVGLDGKRVRDLAQYTYLRVVTDSPVMELLVYQDGRYQPIHATVPGRRFGLLLTSWP